jgi:hypothetical protein
VATTYGARLNFSRHQRRKLQGPCPWRLLAGSWPDAEEQGSNHDLEGKGGYGEMATSGFTCGKCNCKGNAKWCVDAARTHLFVVWARPHVEGSSLTPLLCRTAQPRPLTRQAEYL